MKIFYTVRDIEDMHAAGTVEIELHDDIVLTDVAREKAIALGMRLTRVESVSLQRIDSSKTIDSVRKINISAVLPKTSPAVAASYKAQNGAKSTPSDLIIKIKEAVAARLGTEKYNDLLDKIIPQVMSQLKK